MANVPSCFRRVWPIMMGRRCMGLEGFKIVSGGQTGADRAALDWAIEHGIAHGGWCPKGRIAEDGVIDVRYELKETPSSDSIQRTEWNVRDSDGTVIFSIGETLTGGSQKTFEFARQYEKPVLHISNAAGMTTAREALRRFVKEHRINVLNIAGPRGSEEPGVGAFVKEVLAAGL